MIDVTFQLTHHAQTRIRQRGLRERDIAAAIRHGIEIRENVFASTSKRAGSSSSKRLFFIVTEGSNVITVFHKYKPTLRTDPRRDPKFRRRRKRLDAEKRRGSIR